MKIIIYQPKIGKSALNEDWVNKKHFLKIKKLIRTYKPELMLFPELWPGYKWAMETLDKISEKDKVAFIAGTKWPEGNKLYNVCVLIQNGVIKQMHKKIMLWNGEKKIFTPGSKIDIFKLYKTRIGILICYDFSRKNKKNIHKTAINSDLVLITANIDTEYINSAWEKEPKKLSKNYDLPVAVTNAAGFYKVKKRRYGGGRSRIMANGINVKKLSNKEGYIAFEFKDKQIKLIK